MLFFCTASIQNVRKLVRRWALGCGLHFVEVNLGDIACHHDDAVESGWMFE